MLGEMPSSVPDTQHEAVFIDIYRHQAKAIFTAERAEREALLRGSLVGQFYLELNAADVCPPS